LELNIWSGPEPVPLAAAVAVARARARVAAAARRTARATAVVVATTTATAAVTVAVIVAATITAAVTVAIIVAATATVVVAVAPTATTATVAAAAAAPAPAVPAATAATTASHVAVIFKAVLDDTLRLLAVPPVGSEDQQLRSTRERTHAQTKHVSAVSHATPTRRAVACEHTCSVSPPRSEALVKMKVAVRPSTLRRPSPLCPVMKPTERVGSDMISTSCDGEEGEQSRSTAC
jgi:hypothetical protein